MGYPLGERGWTAGSEAASAYLIRSRPSGRKINIRACCYCTARGRAVTRAQHNIYTAGPTHNHKDTLTLAATCTCTLFEDEQTLSCVHVHTQETGVRMEKNKFLCARTAEMVTVMLLN